MFLFYSVLLGVVLLLAYTGLCRLKQRLLYLPHKLAPTDLPELKNNDKLLSTYVRTKMGNDLLSVVQSKELNRKITVFSHGNYGNLFDYCFLFDVLGSLILWDYRGYGLSSGTPHERLNGWDLSAVIDAIPSVTAENLVLVGHSLGTNVTLNYLDCAMRHQLAVPHTVVLIHPFLRFSDVCFHHTGWSFMRLVGKLLGDMDESETVLRYLDYHPANQLHILYTPKDRVTPTQPVLEFLRCVDERVHLVNVGGDHHQIFSNQKIFDSLTQIIDGSSTSSQEKGNGR